MSKKIKENDVIELDYIAKTKEDKEVFDTTYEEVAQNEGIQNPTDTLVFPVGKGYVVKGLDEQLIGKRIEKEHTIKVSKEDGFGKKDAKKIKMIPQRIFKKKNINPTPGMAYEIDGEVGVVKSSGSGRVIVDFNHPLSGHDLIYEVKINRIVEDEEEKIRSTLKMMQLKDPLIEINNGEVKVGLEGQGLPKEIIKQIESEIKDVSDIKEVSVLSKKLMKKKDSKEDKNEKKNKKSSKKKSKSKKSKSDDKKKSSKKKSSSKKKKSKKNSKKSNKKEDKKEKKSKKSSKKKSTKSKKDDKKKSSKKKSSSKKKKSSKSKK
ncbi:MAG: FKBP-type peptidyl-prolyl cis-trans isomerase [Candidatus Woesearchaeota archaeon]